MKRLKISNLNEFLEIEFSNSFEILHELEKTVFNNKVEEVLLIPYKDDGDCIFDLISLEFNDEYFNREDFIDMDFKRLNLNNFKNVIFTYQYSSTIS